MKIVSTLAWFLSNRLVRPDNQSYKIHDPLIIVRMNNAGHNVSGNLFFENARLFIVFYVDISEPVGAVITSKPPF